MNEAAKPLKHERRGRTNGWLPILQSEDALHLPRRLEALVDRCQPVLDPVGLLVAHEVAEVLLNLLRRHCW